MISKCRLCTKIFAVLIALTRSPVVAGELDDIEILATLSLEELLAVTVIETASGVEETLAEAPATMMVITADDIRARGYTDLTEVVADLPGFDVMIPNGTSYMMAYQRGYRTPHTSRTLFMIDGVVENLLWSHEPAISRQYPLTHIERIEVLYGPASAVYGPNAFLGIINLITRKAADLGVGQYHAELDWLTGSYNSKGLDAVLQGKPTADLAFSLTYKMFKSDEPDFSGDFGFLDQSWFGDEHAWGPILQHKHEDRQFGEYHDPTDDYGVFGDVRYKDLKLGLIHWRREEAYGPYYAAEHAQNNAFWNKSSDQAWLKYTAKPAAKLTVRSLLRYRESRRYGLWVEAEPDWNPGMAEYSYVSYTHWNTENNSWLFKQDFDWQWQDNLRLSAGVKYERKELTKAYDVPGYWSSAVSSSAENGSGIVHSSEPVYIRPPAPATMPADNLAHTEDMGIYLQAIRDWEQYRVNVGLRYDKNSMYGSVVTPRASLVFRHTDKLVFKLLYGEAFQEPAPLQLWGGWSGRQANPDLQPEKARNLEFVVLHQNRRLSHEASLYYAHYQDVIKEEAENAGKRDIYGFEYRAKALLPHFLPGSEDLEVDFNYTYTHAVSSRRYDPDSGEWWEDSAILGDIAPHKFNLGVNVPLPKGWNFHLRGNFVGPRDLYLRNPLRTQGEKLDHYFTLNSVLRYQRKPFEVVFKIKNLLDDRYFHPGPELAGSGNDFSQRALGYQNSLVPQPGRSLWLVLKLFSAPGR